MRRVVCVPMCPPQTQAIIRCVLRLNITGATALCRLSSYAALTAACRPTSRISTRSYRSVRGRSLAGFFGDVSVLRDSVLFAQYLELATRLPRMPATEAAAQLQRLLRAAVDDDCPTAPQPQCPQPAERIKQALLDSIESGATLDELARAFGCRKETLIRVFRRAFHITPHAFVNNARIERAKRRRRADPRSRVWFSRLSEQHQAAWWVPAGHRPSAEEGRDAC